MYLQFYTDMDALLSAVYDIDFLLMATAGGVEVRAEVLAPQNTNQPEGTDPGSTPVTSPNPTSNRQKRKRPDEEVVALIRLIKMCQMNHNEMLEHLPFAQMGFESSMTHLLDKM